MTRVLIDSSDGPRQWSTVGAGPDILAASWAALADSFEYGVTTSEPQAAAATAIDHESTRRTATR